MRKAIEERCWFLFMEVMKMIDVYLEYCESKQLRPRTIGSYRQALELFAVWLKESEGIEEIEDVKDTTIRRYIMNLQQRGKYTAVTDAASLLSNYPDRRKDFGGKISNCMARSRLVSLSARLSGWI